MIITVTMNPAIDKTVEIGGLVHGGLNRIQKIVLDAGGKGINVSKTVKALGGTAAATGFLGGSSGSVIERVLGEYGIQADFVKVGGETRTNMKVVEKGGIVTELNEPGPAVTGEQIEQLLEKLTDYASGDVLFVLSGSVPQGVDKNIYRVITERVHEKGAAVLLDADGELFSQAMEAGPDIVKPNHIELAEYFRKKTAAEEMHIAEKNQSIQEQMLIFGEALLSRGVRLAAVSMGKEGALFLQKDQRYRCPGLNVEVHSTVGAGDAMVAALAYGWEQHMSLQETAALGMAVSAGAVMTQGTKPPTREMTDQLMQQVQLEKL